MKNWLLFKAWRHKLSGSVAFLSLLVVLLWPSIPLRSLDTWFRTLLYLFPTNVFYPFLAFFTASLIAVYVYNKKVETCCAINEIKSGTTASFIGVFIGACPACIPVLAFFLPLSITLTLSYLSPLFLVASTIILFFAIYRMNGFKNFGGNKNEK